MATTTQAPIRVLVVDDSTPFRRAACLVVDSTPGFEVVGAACTGKEAVALAGTLGPDLVLMDVRMPDMTGLEATREIAAARPATVVILISGFPDVDLPTAARDCGAAESLHKRDLRPARLRDLWQRHGVPPTGTGTQATVG